MRSSGFTVTEILFAIAIVAVVAMFAFPAAKDFMEGGRLTSTANSFVEAFMTARSEAVKRGAAVRVIPGAGAIGFRVVTSAAPDQSIADFPAIPTGMTVAFYENEVPANIEFVEYQPNGIRSGGAQAISVYICNSEGDRGRRVDLAASGGTQVEKIEAECPGI